MTGDMEKIRKEKPGDNGVGGKQMNESNTNNNNSCSTPNSARFSKRNGEEQPLFKKPRLDVSFVMLPEFQYDDGAIILRNYDSLKIVDGSKGQDSSIECVSECSTCGDTGFPSELFRCTRCSVRLQHTYCSNSYNPRKRWFIGLCNWCEMEVAPTASSSKQSAATPDNIHDTNPHAGGLLSNRRDSSNNCPWLEKRNLVDCLLGAALRHPSVGLSNMEELLPHTTRAVKGRRSPSFDMVEKAKRSGPSCESVVKTLNKMSSGSLSSSGSIGGDGKVLHTSPGGDGCGHRDKMPSMLKRSHSHLHSCKAAAAAAAVGGESSSGKENLRDTITSNGDSTDKRMAARPGGGSQSEKLSTTTPAARKSPSVALTKRRKSPRGDNDDKSETTVDNTVRTTSLRCSPTGCTNGAAAAAGAGVAKGGEGHGDEGRKIKEGNCRIRGEKSEAAAPPDSPSRETTSIRRSQDHKEIRGVSARRGVGGAFAAAGVDRRSPVRSDSSSAGGSDCSNVTEVQRIGNHHGKGISSSRDTPLRKSHSFKQQHAQARLVRPTLIIEKTKSHTIGASKTSKRFSDLKDAKLRRSSNSPRVSAAHFKCLSDILC